MKRLCAVVLCLSLLCIPVRAEEEKLVALTFDDGPSGRFTRRLLAGLAERDARATFLLCGYRMEQYPALTEEICRAGHEIGLHGYSHKSMQKMTQAEVTREITRTMDLVPEGCPVAFLRTPGGLCGSCVRSAAAQQGLAVLSWSVDPQDWNTDDAEKIRQDVVRRVRDGDVILLHDMSDSSVDAALAIVDELQDRGFRFVTASELARASGIALIPGESYTRFIPTGPDGSLK